MINVKYYQDVKMVAMCDIELLGKTLKSGNFEINVTERFYKGINMDKSQIAEILKDALNANIIGEKSVKVAQELNFIKKENIKHIAGVPHAIIVCV